MVGFVIVWVLVFVGFLWGFVWDGVALVVCEDAVFVAYDFGGLAGDHLYVLRWEKLGGLYGAIGFAGA